MGENVAEVIETMLASVQDAVDDPDAAFKLRTARQLVVLCGEQQAAAENALETAELDPDTREDLRQLGYLD